MSKYNVDFLDEDFFHFIMSPAPSGEKCPVCCKAPYDGQKWVQIVKCGHGLHYDCIHSQMWSSTACMVCKQQFRD